MPPGTYTIGTYTIPILYAGIGSMDIVLPGSIGLTGGRNSAQDFINNVSTNGMTEFINDGVLTFPNDGVTHFSTIHLTLTGSSVASIKGRIALDGLYYNNTLNPAAPIGPVTMEFRTPGTTTVLFKNTLPLLPDPTNAQFSTYSLSNVTAGTYDIAFKDPKHLRVVLRSVTVAGTLTLPDVTLPGGDANNDNVVDIGDFGVLINAYNTDYTTAGYDARADFNYDGVVDIGDFGILVNEYNNAGAP